MPYTLHELNQMDQAAWTNALGFVFEHTPQVAERTWAARPFASVAALHAALVDTMFAMPAEQQRELIRAHPDLAGRAAIAGKLTAESAREQASARLDRLTPAEFARFTALNNAYRQRFQFPFIICVRNHTRDTILAAFEQRLGNTTAQEMQTALREIAAIAELRLRDAVVA